MGLLESIKNAVRRYQTGAKVIIRSESGIVLIDSMLGVTIISVALLAILYTNFISTKTTNHSTERTQAMYIAQQTLDSFKRFDGQPIINTAIAPTKVTQGNIDYRVSVNEIIIAEVNGYRDTTTYNLKTYQVTVGWPFSNTAGNETNKLQMIGYYYVHP